MTFEYAEMTFEVAEMTFEVAEMAFEVAEMAFESAEMIKQHCAFISLIDNPYVSSIIHDNSNKIHVTMQNPKNLVVN